MLNVSKINKVILMAGLAMVFSLGMGDNAFADFEDTLDTASAPQKSKAQQKAEQRRSTADEKTADAERAIKEQWTTARDERDKAQKDYQAKNEAYNKCLSNGGDCSAQRQAAEEAKATYNTSLKNFNQAQKEVSKIANEATKAENKAAVAEQKAKEKALKEAEKDQKKKERELQKAQKALEKCQKKGGDCSAEESAVSNAQTSLDNAKYKVESAQRKMDGNSSSGSDGTSGSSEDFLKENLGLNAADQAALDGGFDNMDRNAQARVISKLNNYKTQKESELKSAQADCTRYSGMTSKDAQAKARQACANATALEKELEKINEISAGMKVKPLELAESVKRAKKVQIYHETVDNKKDFHGIASFEAAKKVMGEGLIAPDLSEEKYAAGNASNVLTAVTRRAARAILELKQIVYVFAGFGLIGFAWAAIFNKISWKWFANIAMGLFLVANMGRLIEYFAKGETGEYYAAAWNDGAVDGNGGNISIGDVFNDAFVVYGDNPVSRWAPGIRLFENTEFENTEENPEEFSASAAGFCKGTSGSGWANFTSCIKDIVSTAKKTADAVKTAKATVDDVKARAEEVAGRAKVIAQAAKNMKGASLSEIINNTKTIIGQTTDIVSTTTGAVGSIGAGVGRIANDVQDIGKSVEQQNELESRRNRGEATNKVNANLKGQEWDPNRKGVENVDGEYATDNTTFKKVRDALNTVNQESQSLNYSTQSGLGAASTTVNIVSGVFGGDKKSPTKASVPAQAPVPTNASGTNNSGNRGNSNGGNSGSNNGNGSSDPSVNLSRDNNNGSGAGSGNDKRIPETDLPAADKDVGPMIDADLELPLPNRESKPDVSVTPDLPKPDKGTRPEVGITPDRPQQEPVVDIAPDLPKPDKGTEPKADTEPSQPPLTNKDPVPPVKAEAVEAGAPSDTTGGESPEKVDMEESPSEEEIAALTVEADALAAEAEAKAAAADEICASNPDSQLCIAAKASAEMAKTLSEEKKGALDELGEKMPKVAKAGLPEESYESGVTPEAKRQAEERAYGEEQKKLEKAKQNLTDKETLEKGLQEEYQKAAQKAAETGLDSDKKVADRLKRSYNLAVSEREAAANRFSLQEQGLKQMSNRETRPVDAFLVR